jgi:tetratricopeptide (TPR) repeat protein
MKTQKQSKAQGKKPTSLNVLWMEMALLTIGCLIAYQPVYSNALIDWDDLKYITQNAITQDLSFQGLVNMFRTPVMGNYHPLTMLSLALNFKLSGDSAFAYHFTNLLLHIANSVLVLLVVQALGLSRVVGRTAAILFALHPLHVESVAWAAERKDVLYTCFALLSWLYFLKFRQAEVPSWKWYGVSIFFFVCACLSKGMAVTLPVLLVSGEFLCKGKDAVLSALRWIFPFIAISFGFGWVAIWAQEIQGGMDIQYDLDVLTRVLIALRGYWFYLQQTFWPIGLSPIYPYPASVPQLPIIWYVQILLALALIGFGMFQSWKDKRVGFVLLGYSGVIFPVLQILPVGDAVAADRYFYLASVPVFIGLGMLWDFTRNRWGKSILTPSLLLVLVMAGLTWFQSGLWKDEVRLFEHAVKHYPESAVAWNNLGAMFQRKEKFAEAIPYYEKAIALRPEYTIALCNLGISYGRTGNMEKAIQLLQKSIGTDSTHAESYGNLGNAYVMTGRREEALQLFTRAVALNPRYVEAWYNLGIYYRENKNPQKAAEFFKKSVAIRNQFPEGWWSLSAVLFESGDQAGAIEAARTSARQGNPAASEWLRVNKIN